MTSVALISVVFIVSCFMIESSVILVHKTCRGGGAEAEAEYLYISLPEILDNLNYFL